MINEYENVFEEMHEEILLANGGIDFVRVNDVVEANMHRFNGYQRDAVRTNFMVYSARKRRGEISSLRSR